jgi:phospholipase C
MTDKTPTQNDTSFNPGPLNPDRRLVLGGIAAAIGAASVDSPAQAATHSRRDVLKGTALSDSAVDAALREIENVVVIFCENRSFNNLFADFPGLQVPLSVVDPETCKQRDRDGTPSRPCRRSGMAWCLKSRWWSIRSI